jgi:hypothetical protein
MQDLGSIFEAMIAGVKIVWTPEDICGPSFVTSTAITQKLSRDPPKIYEARDRRATERQTSRCLRYVAHRFRFVATASPNEM